MASGLHKNQYKKIYFSLIFISIFIATLLFPSNTKAMVVASPIPNLSDFIVSLQDGNENSLRGIYVANVMANAIIQQPMGNPGFVSNQEQTLTQFSIASEVGNIGLLAHNYLAGADFSSISIDDRIVLIYGDGHTQTFLVTSIQKYQAISPLSPWSNFKTLGTEEFLTAEQLFNKVYRGDFHLTLQTCIEENGNESWGRLFILAVPITANPPQLKSTIQSK